MPEPKPARPYMPGYEEMLDVGAGLMPWPSAAESFGQARNYWLATVRPDGRPHLMPVWGLWLDGRFVFSTGVRSRKARNLAQRPNCVVAAEHDGQAVIVEGVVEELTDRESIRRYLHAYNPKYDWNQTADQGPFFTLRPSVAFSFVEDAGETGGSPTRWTFDD